MYNFDAVYMFHLRGGGGMGTEILKNKFNIHLHIYLIMSTDMSRVS